MSGRVLTNEEIGAIVAEPWQAHLCDYNDLARTLETLEKTRGLLSELVDPDECWYDHHGYCQTHTLDEKPCPHTRARALLSGFSGDAPSEEE